MRLRGDLQPLGLPVDGDHTQKSGGQVIRPAASDGGASQRGGFGVLNSSPEMEGTISSSVAITLGKGKQREETISVLPKYFNLHVFLGVPVGGDIRLDDIHITDFEDDEFFKTLRKSYIKIKGFFRFYLGIWKYAHCDFYRFEKFDSEEFAPLERNSVPTPQNTEYQYKLVKRMPPISRHEFKKRFYWCYGRCLLGILGLPSRFHGCKKRCRTCPDAVDLVPKRLSPLEQGGDAREEFWGLYVGEVISAITVVVYLILILIAPFVLCFLWLFFWGHPDDLQNASVPLLCTLALIGVSSCGLFGGSLQSNRAV